MENLQKKIDNLKWEDSQKNGKDMCGTYDYCCVCKKGKNPCANAMSKYIKMNKSRREKARAKFNIEGKELNFRATIVEE